MDLTRPWSRRAADVLGGPLLLIAFLTGLRGALVQEEAPVLTRDIPDFDLRSPDGDVLDLEAARLSVVDRKGLTEETQWAALARAGDLAYDHSNQQGAALLVTGGEYAVLTEEDLLAAGTAGHEDRRKKRPIIEVSKLSDRDYVVLRTRSGRQAVLYLRRKSPASASVSWVVGKGASIEKDRIARLVDRRRKEREEARGPDVFGLCTLKRLQGGSPTGFDLESRSPVPISLPSDQGADPASALRRRLALRSSVDLSYDHGRGPLLTIASRRSVPLGPGSLRMHLGKDLKAVPLRSSGLYAPPDLAVGAVFLIETLQGKLALIRVEALGSEEARLRWVIDGDGDGKLAADEAYWRGEVEAAPAEKRG